MDLSASAHNCKVPKFLSRFVDQAEDKEVVAIRDPICLVVQSVEDYNIPDGGRTCRSLQGCVQKKGD